MNVYTIMLGISIFMHNIESKSEIKRAHLSNEWYPQNSVALQKMLFDLDKKAEQHYFADVAGVKIIIAPHGCLKQSGALMAGCFRLLDACDVRRIIILAPCHSVPIEGVLLPSYKTYALRSGTLAVDAKVIKGLQASGKPFFKAKHAKEDAHYKEHTLEIALPFIQKYAPEAKIVPLFVGVLDQKTMFKAAASLKKYIDDTTIIVVSSDFTHYGPRFENVPFKNDETTIFKIRSLDNDLLQPIFHRSFAHFFKKISSTQISLCGKNPLALLLALFEHGICKKEIPYLIGYDASAYYKKDTKNKVSFVGIVFAQPPSGSMPLLTRYEEQSLQELDKNMQKNRMSAHKISENLLYPIMSPALEKPVRLYAHKMQESELKMVS